MCGLDGNFQELAARGRGVTFTRFENANVSSPQFFSI
jgi:hypothetical protein